MVRSLHFSLYRLNNEAIRLVFNLSLVSKLFMGLSQPQIVATRPPVAMNTLKESDQVVVGASGSAASAIVLFSEYTLKTTGCGLPAGPFGLIGAAEGISYLVVAGLAAYSLFIKLKTGSGLPAGPGGVLIAAEGLSSLAIVAGLVVLGFQIADYGYVPNAVPVEGGICS